ncbi:MAG: Transcriptional regulator, AsnC family, partial [uncultured Craurococcus sp.]
GENPCRARCARPSHPPRPAARRPPAGGGAGRAGRPLPHPLPAPRPPAGGGGHHHPLRRGAGPDAARPAAPGLRHGRPREPCGGGGGPLPQVAGRAAGGSGRLCDERRDGLPPPRPRRGFRGLCGFRAEGPAAHAGGEGDAQQLRPHRAQAPGRGSGI